MSVFNVNHGGIRLRIALLPTVADVNARYRVGRRHAKDEVIHGFFQPTTSTSATYDGTIVLGLDSCLDEIIPHEVAHAVIHCERGISANNDEFAATAIGLLSARIFSKIRRLSSTNERSVS